MSFLKKGLLSNYISDKDDSQNYRYMKYLLNNNEGIKKIWSRKYLNRNQNRCCIYFEFYGTGGIEAVFQFSLPAQSIDFSYPQRVFETKTFGGSIFEDYGNDSITISIQGTTANSDIRYFISGNHDGAEKKGDGLYEIQCFQNLLDEYGKTENLKTKKVKLVFENEIYTVFIKEFTKKISKDSPLSILYSINLSAIFDENKDIDFYKLMSETTFKEKLNNLLKQFMTIKEKVDLWVSKLEKGLQIYEDFYEICAAIRNALSETEKSINNIVNLFLAYIDGVTTCVSESVKLADMTVSSGLRVSLGTIDKTVDSVVSLVKAIGEGIEFFETFTEKYGEMAGSIVEQWNMSGQEIIDTGKYMMTLLDYDAEKLDASVDQITSNCDAATVPGDNDTDDSIVFVYGVKEHTLTSNGSWESLAANFYGDSSKASLLSSFNNQKLQIENGSMPSPGSIVYIPVLESTSGFDGTNNVFNPPDVVDNYGKDISIASNGDLNFHNGDFANTDSLETLMQGVINRLSTTVGSRLRDAVYGIKTNIGSADNAIQVVISSSIEMTLLADPRIKSVDTITFNGNGDKLDVTVEFTDINDNKSLIGGTF